MPVEVQGTLLSFDPVSIRIKTTTGDIVQAQIDPRRLTPDGIALQGIPDPEVIVQTIAKTDYIRAGMYVRFDADLDGRKKAHEMLKEISVIGRTRDTIFGFLEGPEIEPAPEDDDKGRGGMKMYTVAGQVLDAKRGTLNIAVPGDRNMENIRVRVAGDALVKLAVPDLSLAKAGDKVEAKGFAIRLPQFYGTQVIITRPDAVDDEDAIAKANVAKRPGRPGPLLPNVDAKPDAPKAGGGKRPGLILKIN